MQTLAKKYIEYKSTLKQAFTPRLAEIREYLGSYVEEAQLNNDFLA